MYCRYAYWYPACQHGDNYPSIGPNNCSLIFQWTSKTKSLSVPDKLLLQKPEPISSLPIYVDFLPALESRKPISLGAEDEHDFFIVPEMCNVDGPLFRDRWRKSLCKAEINAITTEMSEKHKRCYQIMKYFSQTFDILSSYYIYNYHIKAVFLCHHTTCSDTTDNCVDCVMKIIQDLLQAYESKELLSYQSNLNILDKRILYKPQMGSFERYIDKLCSVSINDSWETFIRKW